MVVFTLTGLDTNVQLTQHPEYPEYTAPSITASYFLDLSMNIVDLSGVFFFSTTHPDESTLIFPVYVLDFSNDYGKTTNVPLLNYNQVSSLITFTTTDTILFNAETPTGYDNSAYYWQDISNSIVSDPYSYLYGAFAFTNSTNTGTGYVEYTLNTTSTTGGFVELKIKPNNRARKYFNVTSANNTIELAIVTTSNYSSVAENPIPVNTTQTFTIPEKNYSVLQLEEVVNSLLSSNYITAVYNEQSNKFTFSRLNYDFQIGGTATTWLGFSSSTITDNVSSTGLLVSTTEILDSAGTISIYVNNVLQTEWSNNLNMATGTIPLVYRYSFNDGEILKVDSNNLGGFAIYWVKIIHRDTVFNDDMAFRAESSYWPDISFSEGIISDCVKSDILTYSVPKTTKTIGPAWLAKNITNGYNNSDIFSNENQLVKSYVDLDKRKNIVVEGDANVSANFGSYKYYRFVISKLADTANSGSTNIYPSIFRIFPYQQNGNIIIPTNSIFSASSGSINGNSRKIFLYDNAKLFNKNSYFTYETTGWRGGRNAHYLPQAKIDSLPIDSDKFGNGYITTNGIFGEYIEWSYDTSVELSKLEVMFGYSMTTYNSGVENVRYGDTTPAQEVSLFGSNDETAIYNDKTWTTINTWSNNDNGAQWNEWCYLWDNTIQAPPNIPSTWYTLSIADGIKDELINKIDNAGNVENPLSNINNDVTNVSREIVNSMLDSSDPEVVQRVHTMIENNQIAYPYQTHNVTVNDASNCLIDGEINPTITLVRGLTYDFILNNPFITDPIIYETTSGTVQLPDFEANIDSSLTDDSRRDLIFAYKIEESTYDTITNQSSVTLEGVINSHWGQHINDEIIIDNDNYEEFILNTGRTYSMTFASGSELIGATAIRKNGFPSIANGSNNFLVSHGNSIVTLYVITLNHNNGSVEYGYNGWEQSVMENLGYTYLSSEDIDTFPSIVDMTYGKVYKKVINAYSIDNFNPIFRDNKFLLSLPTIDYTTKFDVSTISFQYNDASTVLKLSPEILTDVPANNQPQTYVFHNIQFNDPNDYRWLLRLGEGNDDLFGLTSGIDGDGNGNYYIGARNGVGENHLFTSIDTNNLHTLILSYDGIDKIKLIKIVGNTIKEEVTTFTMIHDQSTSASHIFGYHKSYTGHGHGPLNDFDGSADLFLYYNTYISDSQIIFNTIKSLDNTNTIFTPDLPVENISDIYYQDGLSFYLDSSTNHVSDDDYTQVAMPLFYSDVSYSTTDGYPITWENSNYRKIRFTVPFDAPDTLSIISQDSNNNNFTGQINIITNTYLPWIPITFGHNDVLQFRLTYKSDLITDSNGVALDSTGVKLGTNSVENQDYVARLTLKIPEIVYDFTNHADNTTAFTYLNSTDLSHNLVEFTDGYEDSTNGIAFDGSGNNGYIEILNFPGNSGTITINYGANDSSDALQENYIMLTDNVNNTTKIHQITSTINSFTTIYSLKIPYNKTTKSIKIAEESGIILLEKITIQQIF